MRSEWPRKHLAEISEVITGFPFKGEKYLPPKHGVRVVRGDNVTERYLRWGEKEKCWSGVTADLKPYVLRSGDVVIGMDGSKVGKNFAAISPDDEGSLLAQRVARLRAREGISQDYLRYVICNDSFTEYVKAVHTGTSIPHISKGQIENFEVVVPPFEDQQQIAAVLISLDDRITLLRETNATLEAIAQALFKSWFVDFDPVRAKMEGRAPDGMDEATAALFPDGFEESELGLVPKGWTNAPIYDMATFINGAAYKAFEPNAERRGRPIIKIAELKSGVTTQTAYSDVAMPDKYLIETGDILFSWSGNPDTSIDTFVWTFEKAWLNQHIFRVLPNASHERTFVLQMLRHLKPLFTELARNKQTTGLGHVTVADMKRELIAMPPVDLVRQFDLKVGPIHARIFENQRQAQTLSTLRDTLLPRLISGQLRLPEAQAAAAEALA